jgi:hypothetical protein
MVAIFEKIRDVHNKVLLVFPSLFIDMKIYTFLGFMC